jgi:hypothetical protein
MRNIIKKLFITYFTSWWLPFIVMLFVFLILVATIMVCRAIPYSKPLDFLVIGLLVLLGLVLIGIPLAAIWNLIKKRWAKGLINLLITSLVLITAIPFILFVSFVYNFLGPSEDGFGKDIVITADMELEMPGQTRENWPDVPYSDPEGEKLIGVFSNLELWPHESLIDTNIPVLDKLVGDKRALLMRHMATSSRWCLRRERGKIYAFRRFVTGKGRWETSLNGNYTDFDWRTFDRDRARFQVKIIVGIDQQVMRETPFNKLIVMDAGSGQVMLRAKDAPAWPGNETNLVLRSAGPTIEILEIAKTMRRPFTMLALEQMQTELKGLLNSQVARQRGFDPALMPSHSIHRGNPDIWLLDGMQGGIYLVDAYVNPGESGYVYLKVFEATKNTRLSRNRINQYSNEYVGWSDDPEELFFYHTRITVYEGDWDVYYPARFELWFIPDSGEPERKLIEKVFKIEGWQR